MVSGRNRLAAAHGGKVQGASLAVCNSGVVVDLITHGTPVLLARGKLQHINTVEVLKEGISRYGQTSSSANLNRSQVTSS